MLFSNNFEYMVLIEISHFNFTGETRHVRFIKPQALNWWDECHVGPIWAEFTVQGSAEI